MEIKPIRPAGSQSQAERTSVSKCTPHVKNEGKEGLQNGNEETAERSLAMPSQHLGLVFSQVLR